jgi:thiol:disulfide interchange protein DsbC
MKSIHLIVAALVASVGIAAEPAQNVPAQLTKTLHERYPEVPIVDVRPGPMAGLYEVFTGTAIVYSDASGDHLFAGEMIDTKTRRSLTAERLEERSTIDFSTLPVDMAIKEVRGDGKRVMAVFADPDCPFCQRLEKALASVDNVTVYTFLYPLPQLHPGAPRKARKIWCSEDRSKTWTTWMREGSLTAEKEDCNLDTLTQMHDLAEKLKVSATPTVFFPSGRRLSRALTSEEINQLLDAEQAIRTASVP